MTLFEIVAFARSGFFLGIGNPLSALLGVDALQRVPYKREREYHSSLSAGFAENLFDHVGGATLNLSRGLRSP